MHRTVGVAIVICLCRHRRRRRGDDFGRDAGLKQGTKDVFGEENGIRPLEGLIVFRASSTGASEGSGVEPPLFDPDPGVMAASAARMGLTLPPEMLADLAQGL